MTNADKYLKNNMPITYFLTMCDDMADYLQDREKITMQDIVDYFRVEVQDD